MSGKEFIRDMVLSFFIIVTLVNVSTFVLGSIFQPDIRFGYDAFLSPIVYGLFSMIPIAIMYSKKELSLRQLVLRKILQLLSLIVILVMVSFGVDALQLKNIPMVAAFCGSILVIYILVHVIEWFLDMKKARQMMVDLKSYQESIEDHA